MLLAGALLLIFAPARWPQATDSQDPSQSAPGTLEAIRTLASENEDGGLNELLTRSFDAQRWRQRLLQPDLARRERGFELLIQRARFDPVARAFIEELARATDGGELAWTARLALRELGRARFPLVGGVVDPLGDPAQALGQLMNDLFARNGLNVLVPPVNPVHPEGSSRGRTIEVQQGNQGVVVHVSENLQGELRTRTYSGASLRQLMEENEDLAAALQGMTSFHPTFGEGHGLKLVPQALSLPATTDRLGVIVQPLARERAQAHGLLEDGKSYGLLVERAYPETYAQLLGVGSGDVLVELNGVRLRSGDDIERIMRARAGSDPLTLVFLDELAQRQVRNWGTGAR